MTALTNDAHLTNTPTIMAKFQHETIAIDALKLPAHIPKKPADKAVQSLMRAIDRTRHQILPVLVDDENIIVAGFEIFAAMLELGAAEIGIVRLTNLTQAETSAIMLLLAKIPERSHRDDAAVSAILAEIIIDDPEALDITGFEIAEIDIAIANLNVSDVTAGAIADQAGADDFGETAEAQEPPIVQNGDVFCLGDHRVICGNSLESASYETLMQGNEAAIVLTDPPYNIPIAGHVSGMGKTQLEDFAMGVGEISFAEFTNFLQTMLLLAISVLRLGGLAFVFMDRRHLEELFCATRKVGLRLVDLAIWNKMSGGMGGLYRGQ